MGYNSIAWIPLTAGLTAIGVIASYFAYRRRDGARWPGVRRPGRHPGAGHHPAAGAREEAGEGRQGAGGG